MELIQLERGMDESLLSTEGISLESIQLERGMYKAHSKQKEYCWNLYN